MNINLEKNNLIELEDYQLEEINGGIVGLIIGCIGIAAICYYFGDHSARNLLFLLQSGNTQGRTMVSDNFLLDNITDIH